MKTILCILLLTTLAGCSKPKPITVHPNVIGYVDYDNWVNTGGENDALLSCKFDNEPVKDDLVEISTTTEGYCHDTGIKREPR